MVARLMRTRTSTRNRRFSLKPLPCLGRIAGRYRTEEQMRKTGLILVTGLLATFAIFALVAAACGDDDGDDEPTATSAAATTAPTTAATSAATAASTGTATSGTPSATADPCTLGQ